RHGGRADRQAPVRRRPGRRGPRRPPAGDPPRHAGGVPGRQPGRGAPGNRPDAPDPGAHGRDQAPVRGRSALRCGSGAGRPAGPDPAVAARGQPDLRAPRRRPPGHVHQRLPTGSGPGPGPPARRKLTQMEIAEHIDALRRQGERMADAAERAGLDAPVPPCSPWLVKDLLRHTGYVHRWAAQHITDRPGQILDGPPEEEILAGGADDAELLAWFRAGHAALAQTLATADPALDCATFMAAPSALAFWARRQAHEPATPRADAESASGATPDYEPAFAADGIDELI